MVKPLDFPSPISIVIPAYNEEHRLGSTLESLLSYLRRKKETWEILVVDDGSRDDLNKLIAAFNESRIILLHHVCNRGKGAAVKTGLENARGEFILFTDADLSTPPQQIDYLLEACRQGADIAIGVRLWRRCHQGEVHDYSYRWLARWSYNFFVRLLTGLPFKDTQCGFKMLTRTARDRIVPHLKLTGYAFDVELLALAKRMGLKTIEIPVSWRRVGDSHLKVHIAMWPMLRDLFKVRRWYDSGSST